MSTPVQNIYNIFLSQIGRDILAELPDNIAEELMSTYLQGATVDFYECKKDLQVLDDCINSDLDLDEQYILSNGMIIYWLQPKILTEEVTKMKITPSDYTVKSPANLLDKLMKLKIMTEKDMRKRKIRYSYKNKRVNK